MCANVTAYIKSIWVCEWKHALLFVSADCDCSNLSYKSKPTQLPSCKQLKVVVAVGALVCCAPCVCPVLITCLSTRWDELIFIQSGLCDSFGNSLPCPFYLDQNNCLLSSSKLPMSWTSSSYAMFRKSGWSSFWSLLATTRVVVTPPGFHRDSCCEVSLMALSQCLLPCTTVHW